MPLLSRCTFVCGDGYLPPFAAVPLWPIQYGMADSSLDADTIIAEIDEGAIRP